MKRLKLLSIVFFLISAGLFTYCLVFKNADKDKTGPKITMDQDEIKVSIKTGEEEYLKGITAKDEKDGDVTDSLAVESITNFIEKGRRKVNIIAFDKDNNVSRVTRTIVYTDYTSPVYKLTKPLKFAESPKNLTQNLTAADCMDGDVSDKIKIAFNEEMKGLSAGIYSVNFSVSNSAGDVTNLPVTLEIYDPMQESKRPRLGLSEYLINISKGQGIDPWSYLETVVIDGMEYEKGEDGNFYGTRDPEAVLVREQIIVENPVDVNKTGVYEVKYSATDSEGTEGNIRLIVVVNE